MKKTTKIEKILSKIDWIKIQDYHKKLNIQWDIENKDGNIETKIPGVNDVKNEVQDLLLYMFDNGLDYLSYGNWVIFWENEDDVMLGEVRVIFRLEDYLFKQKKQPSNYVHTPFENSEDVEELKLELERAVEDEDYESAAKLRDKILKLDKKD